MIQIDMEMPKNCNGCLFSVYEEEFNCNYCLFTAKTAIRMRRHDDCPLKEVEENDSRRDNKRS